MIEDTIIPDQTRPRGLLIMLRRCLPSWRCQDITIQDLRNQARLLTEETAWDALLLLALVAQIMPCLVRLNMLLFVDSLWSHRGSNARAKDLPGKPLIESSLQF